MGLYFFLSNHICWCSSCSNSLLSSLRAFHSSNIQPNPCSCPCSCPCPVRAVLAVIASPCLCPCHACLCFVCPSLCRMHQCPLGRLLLGVMNLSVSCFVHLRQHSQYVLTSSLKTPYEVNLARFNCTCFSRSPGNKASREFRKSVCISLASRRLQ